VDTIGTCPRGQLHARHTSTYVRSRILTPQRAVKNPNIKSPKEALTNWLQREPRITSRTDVNQANLKDPLLSFMSQRVLPITATRPGSAAYPQVSLAIQTATENVVAGRSDAAEAAKQLGAGVAKAVGADNVTGAS